MTPTPQQEAIIAAGTAGHSLIVTARAGCAKTSTLNLLSSASPVQSLYIVFNVRNKKEAEATFPAHVQALTWNGLGHRAWQAGRKRLTVDGRKSFLLVDDYCKQKALTVTFDEKRQLSNILNAARTLGLCPKELPGASMTPDTPEGWEEVLAWSEARFDSDQKKLETLHIAQGLLRLSIQRGMDSFIDYLDQIYLPTTFGGMWPSTPRLLLDETQDMSPANQKMAKLIQAPQKIAVGDPKQAIYAFRGAMSDSMDHLEKIMPAGTEWKHLKLTKTFRCGKAIVARQKEFVPDFEAADTNSPGSVHSFPNQDLGGTSSSWVPAMVPEGSAILCRNNAPLISCALKFLRAKRKVTVLGRDFAEKLKKDISKATKGAPGSMPILEVLEKVKVFYESQLEGKKKPSAAQLEQVQDRVAAVAAFAEDCQRLSDLSDAIDRVFSDEIAPITLATGHKAKGLEWDWVMHLNPGLIPSKWSQGDPEAEAQEANLKYVIETRARHTLVIANLEDLEV